jgi:dephospho-CoA kinase
MVVGLAGKSCAGKNAVADLLVKKGWDSVDMDLMAHRILNELSEEAASLFGKGILDHAGQVDRKALGKIVFSDPARLKKLEDLLYPELHKKLDLLLEQQDDTSPSLILNAAALEKRDFWKKCDCILWVTAPLFVRLFRARKRDGKSFPELMRRFHAQRKLNPQYFFNRVDIYVIKNGGNRKRLEKRIDRWLKALPSE